MKKTIKNMVKKSVVNKLLKRQAEHHIPYGDYCYERCHQNLNGRAARIKPCPFWSRDPKKPPQENGICKLLGLKDGVPDAPLGLLWDMVKECGINLDTEE
jgi:hypothetical protein